jgi:hypothetical protein
MLVVSLIRPGRGGPARLVECSPALPAVSDSGCASANLNDRDSESPPGDSDSDPATGTASA